MSGGAFAGLRCKGGLMAIITISRGSFSGGKILAECIAETLGYRCIDRDVIVEKAAAYGVSQQDLRDALQKAPTFWDRFGHKKYVYLTLFQAALTEEARPGKAVYHGNAGHLLLRGVSHVLRARIVAPLEFRTSMVQDRLKLSRAEALAYIQKMDSDRRKWTQYLYGVDWGDPNLYDVVLNLEAIDIKEACDILAAMARIKCFEETPDSARAMEDLALASRIRANLVMDPATSALEVEVVAQKGQVTIKGTIGTLASRREVERVAWKVPGVTGLNLDELLPSRGV
jgi:cytidylate kinase